MADDSQEGATLIIRAWRRPDGGLTARVTHGVAGTEPALEISAAASETEVLDLVRAWMQRIGA